MSVVISNEKRVRIAVEEDEYEKEANEAAGKENGPSEQPAEKPPKKPDKPEKNQPVQSPSSPEDEHRMLTDGNASFLRAARGGNLDKVLDYLQGSTDINTSNANGLNALHLSSKEGHLNIVTELLKRGADVDAATKEPEATVQIPSKEQPVKLKKGNTALHIASLAGQEDIVRMLVEFNANVNVQSQNGFTPLYMAAQENHVKVVKFLLASGANQSLATEDGFTPLAVALQQGHDKVVAVLLENDRAGKTRLPALHIAARKDDTKAASLLLQNGHNPDVPSKSGFTPLHIAAHYGHVNVATLLLQKGASVDHAARNHITPLHVAAKWGRVNMVNTLLDRGARIDAKTRDGLTPLHCSGRSGHEQCVDQLLERGAPISAKTKNGLAPLHMAAQGDHVDSARLLLYHHAPVDDVTVDYLTPLHVAAHCGHHKVAKLLLDRKANPSARALNGFTPLHIACKKNRVKVIELLLKYGASVQAVTESGLTPLHVAAFMGNINIVMYLIKNGGGVDETNVRGETPLHLAARANQIEVIRVLLSNGAKVDARAHENQTPLHIAARLGNAEIVKLLLDNGASPDAQTRDLYTALHIAAREGKEDVAQVLLDNGATLSMTTKKDFTPLHVAAKYGRYDVAQLLLSRYASPDATAQNGLTPLHIAAHYDNVKVAMLLLDQGASPHKTAKNGFTPLHIASKKNQMDVATTLLEYGADANAMTKQGISPIHLAAQEGHTEMLALLLERGAKPNIQSKNGLTPLHLAAQEDQLEAVSMLLDNGSQIDPQTKAGYTPLHVACHYGNLKTVTYLLEHGSAVQAKTKHGLTPLHQGAQQGHVAIINILLQHKADPNEIANNGYTALGIAKRFGYISVVNTLTIVTTETSTVISPTEEKLKVQVPETMQVTFMSDTEDEGDDVSMTGDQSLLTPQEIRTMGDDSVINDHRRSWEDDWMRGEPVMNYYTGHESLSGHYGGDKQRPAYSPTGYSTMDSRNSTLNRDYNAPLGRPDDSIIEGEMICATTESVVESAPPLLSSTPNRHSTGPVITLNGKTYNIGDPYVDDNGRLISGKAFGPNGRPVSVTLDNAPMHQMPFFAGFLISFIVDARGGTMRSCRLPGLRVVVPPQRASGPTRVTCRLIKRTKLTTQPPLMENESLASRVLEVGPANTQFLGPVLIEVPHFASLRGNEREIVILRSETGETWKEHSLDANEEEIQKSMEGYDQEDNDQSKGQSDRRMCRILTKDFPQYFAIISRVRQETNTIGPSGGMLNSTVVPQVQAVFPEGTLTKKIKVGLQAQPVGNDVVKKVLGNRVMVSPIVTIEPRRRKFHKPITVTIPVPTAYNQGVINGYGGDFPTLRLLCSITGGTAPAQWEDITGTTPLTFVNDCVSFTTTVSARFWLMDCKEIDQASNFARELYQELKAVPFMAKFVVYAKTHDPVEGRVRVFCVTDDKSEKSLEQQENFKEVARSKFVEVLESRPVFIEMAGNLVPVQKSGDQLNLAFTAFHENRLPFFVRVRDQSSERCGRLSFMREPKVQRGLPPQKAACNLNVTMPSYVKEQDGVPSNLNFASLKLRKRYTFLQDPSMSPKSAHQRAEIRLWDAANQVGDQWQDLGRELGLSERELKAIERENDDRPEQAFVMLHNWSEQEGKDATSERLEEALRSIGRGDIIDRCLGNYVSLDVSAQPDDDSEMMRDIEMALNQPDRLGNDMDAFSPQGQADITLEFSGDVKESAAAAEFYEEIKEEILEKHEEERRELHFEPSFGTLEETKEEDSPSPTGPQKSNMDMASAGPSSSKSVTVTQTRVTVTSKTESGPESSAETAVFVGTADRTLEKAAEQIRVQVDSISSEGGVETDELEGVQLAPHMSQVRIEVDEAPTPDRMSSDENLYIAHAANIVQEPEIEASAEQEEESINPYRDMEPDPIGDVVIEEPQIQAQSEHRVESINPYADMEPEPLTGSEPIEEPAVAAVSSSDVHGINPDLMGDPEPLDATGNIPGPDLTDIRHTSMGAQAWEGDTSPSQPTCPQSPFEDFKMGHPGESTVQQITMESKIVMSKSETQRSEPTVTGYRVSTSEVTVSESGSPRLLEDEVPLATEQFAEDVQDSARPTDLGEPGKPAEHQETTGVETTRSETITRTVTTVEQKIITQESTKIETKEDIPEEPSKASEECKEAVLDYEIRPGAKASDEPKEPEPVETFETEVKETEKWKEPEPVELTQSQVEQEIPVKEVEQKPEETKEVVLEYETTKTVQPYEEPVVEEDTRVPQDLDLQSKDQDVSLERLVQSPKPVASPDAEQKEAIYDYEEQREVTVITQTTKTVNVVEIQEERKDDEPTQEPEVSEPITEQQDSPVRTLQDFDKPIAVQEVQEEETILEPTMHPVTDEHTFEHEETKDSIGEVVKDEPETIEEKEPSEEPVIEMDKVEEVKEEVEEAPESPIKDTLPKEHETVTHYQETVTTVVTTTEVQGHGGEEEIDGGMFSRPTVQEDTEETNIPGKQVREYVTNVVDSAISQEQSRAEIVDQAKDERPVDSDSIPEVLQVDDSQTSTTVSEKKTDEVVFKETVQIIEKKQVAFSDEPEEEQVPTVTSESIPDTTEEDIPKEDDFQISTTYTEKETHEVVVKESVQVIDKKQVVFEDEPEEEQAPTVTSESVSDTPEDIPKEDDSQITTTYTETHEVVTKETVQVIDKKQVVFEDEPEEEQAPTAGSESIPDTPEDIPKEDDSQISTTYKETHEVVVKETVPVIEEEKVVFEDEPEEEKVPTVTSQSIPDVSEDIPKEDDSRISTTYTEKETREVVVKETVQVIGEEKVVYEDEPQEEQAPTVSSESIQDVPEDIPKEDDSQIGTTYTEKETHEVVVKESVQVIDKKQVVFEDEPEEEQVPTVSSESIPDVHEDIPKEDDSQISTSYTETHEVVVKETVPVIEEEKVVFEDEPQEEQAPTVSSESVPDTPEDIPKEDDSQISATYTEKETHEVVVKESVQVIDKKQVVFEDEPEEKQAPTVSSESIPDVLDDIPKDDDSQISASYTETHEVVVKETVQVIKEEKVVFEDESQEEQAPTVSSVSIPDTPEDIPNEDDSQISTSYTETDEVVVKEIAQVIEEKKVVFEDKPEEEQAPTVKSESVPDVPEDIPKEDDSQITTTYTEKETHEVVVKETVKVIEEEKVVFEDEPEEQQAPTVKSESVPDVLEDIPKEDGQQILTTYTEQIKEEVAVKETVHIVETKQTIFDDEFIPRRPEEDQIDVDYDLRFDEPETDTSVQEPTEAQSEPLIDEDVIVEEKAKPAEETDMQLLEMEKTPQEDIPKEPMEELPVEDTEPAQDMTLHRREEFTTQNLEFLGAPEYEEEDVSTSMEVMPSERENIDGDDDFLEDIQEEPECEIPLDEAEKTDVGPTEATYMYEERTQQVIISNEQAEPGSLISESHEEVISEERIGEKSVTTEFSQTVLHEEIHHITSDTPAEVEEDAHKQDEETRDVIHEDVEETEVTAAYSEINFQTEPIMDQAEVEEEEPVQVPDTTEKISQEPIGDEPEVRVETRDSAPFDEATAGSQVDEESISEERIGEKVVTSTFNETVLHKEIHNIVEECPPNVEDDSELPKEGVKDNIHETVHQTTVTTTHTEVHKLSTLPITVQDVEELHLEEQHTLEEEQTQPTHEEREDLSPRDEGMTSEDVEELQEDHQGQIPENGSYSHGTTTEETRTTVITREVRFVEDVKVDASEPEDETEPDMTEHDISIDEDQSDDSDMIPEIKLDLQSDEIVQDDDVMAERRARDHGYLIEPDPPTEESEIILGEDGISGEQLGVDDDEDLDTKTESISYMEEQVDETPLAREDQPEAESVPADYDIQTSVASDIPLVEDNAEQKPELKEEESDVTTSYKTIEEAMVIEGEVFLESEPREEQEPHDGEMLHVEPEPATEPEDGRSTPDILDITGEYATSYGHVEMSRQSFEIDEPVSPLDDTHEEEEGETSRYHEQIEMNTSDAKEGAALVAVEQQYLVDTPASETSDHDEWVETQVGDATLRTRQTHREDTYTDETEGGQTVYTRHVVTETRVITSGGPLVESIMHPADYPEELIIQAQPPSPDSLLTPEIQELPDTPDSSTHEGSTEPTDHQGFCYESMDVTQSTSESTQFVVDGEVVDYQDDQEEPQEEALLDGPTESDYYDPSLIGVSQQQEFEYQEEEPEPEIIDSPQDVEFPVGEDIPPQHYSDLALQQEVSASLSHEEQALGDVEHSESMIQESHVETLVYSQEHYSQEQYVPDTETFDVADEDRADSVVSPRPPEPVSEVETQLPPTDLNVLESSTAPEPEAEQVEEGAVGGDEVDSPTKPYQGQIPIPTSPETQGSEEPPKSPQGSCDDQSTHVVTHEEFETKQEDGGVVKKSVHVTRTTFRREVSFPGEAVQSGEAILQTRSVSEFLAGPEQTQPRSREVLRQDSQNTSQRIPSHALHESNLGSNLKIWLLNIDPKVLVVCLGLLTVAFLMFL